MQYIQITVGEYAFPVREAFRKYNSHGNILKHWYYKYRRVVITSVNIFFTVFIRILERLEPSKKILINAPKDFDVLVFCYFFYHGCILIKYKDSIWNPKTRIKWPNNENIGRNETSLFGGCFLHSSSEASVFETRIKHE